MIQTLFPKNDAVFQDDTARTVPSWFERHESKFQHLPRPAQTPHLTITGPLVSFGE
jgi:hypothetical protein